MAKHAAAQRTHRTHTDPSSFPEDVVERRHEVGSEGFSGMVPGAAVRPDHEEGARPDYYTEFGRKGLRRGDEEASAAGEIDSRDTEDDHSGTGSDRLQIEPVEDKGDRGSE
jgi:hypothetical protein